MKMTYATLIGGSLIVFLAVVMAVVFIPGLVWQPPQTFVGHPYSPAEAHGREIFYRNGCNYCHTQYVREWDTASGPESQGGDYHFDNPMILGSERTGPDLSYIGRKRDEAWEIEHWKDPRSVSPLSIMPSFEFLSAAELKDLATYINNLGDRTAAQRMIMPPAVYASVSNPVKMLQATPVAEGESQGWALFRASGLMDGKETYITHCQTCHGCAGNGLGSYGGTLAVTPANFKVDPFRGMTDAEWFWHVSEGVPGSLMPVWKASLTEAQRWNTIRYIQQIFAMPMEHDPDEGKPSGEYANLSNPVPLNVDSLEAGKQIFIRECMVCHGDEGRGHGPYRSGLLPVPPDLGDGSYGDWTDSDYFWRISEGVPWTAMPVWKLRYSEEDRWKLVHYIRVNFTQTEKRPETPAELEYPQPSTVVQMPDDASAVLGQGTFTRMCARCHGFTGLGDGWDGQYLDPKPANFHTSDVAGLSSRDFFARLTYGLRNTAMPSWGEWLPIASRWNDIRYIEEAFVQGSLQPNDQEVLASALEDGATPANYITVSRDLWLGEGHVFSDTNGLNVYGQYCTPCHADNGQGKGPSTGQDKETGARIASPAPLPTGMSDGYIQWRILDGVPNTLMPPFRVLLDTGDLSYADVWDITDHVQRITGGGG
jgi:cytochrome c oxidase cbb3-type subunit 2